MKDKMQCSECEKKINDFIDKKLDYKDTLSLLKHVKNCERCKEELSIAFLVVNGLRKLDSAEAFDLQSELSEHMQSSADWAYGRKRMYQELMLFAVFAAIVAGYFFASFIY